MTQMGIKGMTQHHYWVVPPSLLIILASFFSVSQASATFSGWGIVNMEGAIIDSACAISSESRDQTIDMDTVPTGEIIQEGFGRSKPFSIKLINCELTRPHSSLPGWQYFQVTFDGNVDGKFFGIDGDAKGIALEIKDSQGNSAIPGEAMPMREISHGSMKLDYTMRLVSNKQLLVSGRYKSSIRLKMAYY